MRPLGWLEDSLHSLEALGGPVWGERIPPPRMVLDRIGLDSDAVAPLLAKHSAKGEDWALRHWPWTALGCHWWRMSQESNAKRDRFEITPTKIRESLKRISDNARDILDDLQMLIDLTNTPLPHQHTRAAHINWILNYLYLIQDHDIRLYDFRTTEITGELAVAVVNSRYELHERLVRLSESAGALGDFANRDLLATRSPGEDPGLATFVGELASIWLSLTGRKASVNKISSRPDDPRPAFVRFVQGVADLQVRASAAPRPWTAEAKAFAMVAPTFSQIATAFRGTRPSA